MSLQINVAPDFDAGTTEGAYGQRQLSRIFGKG